MLLARRNQNYNQNWLPSLFNDFMNDDWFTTRTAASVPALNVIENEKNYELEFAVPGLKKEELNLQVDADGVMSISMVRKNEDNKENKKRNYIRREFSYQEFNQSYILPCPRQKSCQGTAGAARADNQISHSYFPSLSANLQLQ
jgi:HSP20 family molecular chaperone IbpA